MPTTEGPTREQELWALALHIERHHGADGARYIAEKVGVHALTGEQGGVDLWRAVAKRFDRLAASHEAS